MRELLLAHPEIDIVAECANGFEAVKAASELNPDLLFLDVQMPKLDGFEVLQLIGPDIAVVFTTAYDQYALRAFEVHAVDYLLKPFNAERFEAALGRAGSGWAKRRLRPWNWRPRRARRRNSWNASWCATGPKWISFPATSSSMPRPRTITCSCAARERTT